MIIVGFLLVIAGSSFVGNQTTSEESYIENFSDNTKAIPKIAPAILNQTYRLHGYINNGQFACAGYRLRLKGSDLTTEAKLLGQYLLKNMPIGHNIIEVYDEKDHYIDKFEIIFDQGYADYIDDERHKIYIDLDNTAEFTDKYEVSFGFDEMNKLHFIETGTSHGIIGDIEFVSLDKTINLYGRVMNDGEALNPLPDITIEVENTDISCVTGKDGGFNLPSVPIREQRLIFYDSSGEAISGVDIYFNIDKGNFCLNSLEKIIIDVGNSDGRLFTNMQIGFEINVENKSLGYDPNKIHGNVESDENRIIYFAICLLFVVVFFIAMIIIDKKRSNRKSIKG